MARIWKATRPLKREDFIHLKGCPVSVAEQVLALVYHGKLKSPYLDWKVVPMFVSTYFSWRTHALIQRMTGWRYNEPGSSQPCT